MMRLIYRLNRLLPFHGLPIARIQWGGNTCTLRNDGWIIISDGQSRDALPITMVSPGLVDALRAELI